MALICGIDPGQAGAFVLIDGESFYSFRKMPINAEKEIDFKKVQEILAEFEIDHIFLERAVPFHMGTKSAFSYGRGFAALEIAILLAGLPVTYIEPAKWTKAMHAGIRNDLKPKAKSVIAVKRLYPHLLFDIPESKGGVLHEGIVDALLIAGFGMRGL